MLDMPPARSYITREHLRPEDTDRAEVAAANTRHFLTQHAIRGAQRSFCDGTGYAQARTHALTHLFCDPPANEAPAGNHCAGTRNASTCGTPYCNDTDARKPHAHGRTASLNSPSDC